MEKQVITLEQLFEKQREKPFLAALEEIPYSDLVRVFPVDVKIGCLCKEAYVTPRGAIKVLYEFHKPVDCCGIALEIVEVTYDNDFKISAPAVIALMRMRT